VIDWVMESRRIALVTGATDGIGRQTALELARAGLRVILHGRSRPKVDEAVAFVRAQVEGCELEGVSFDLGSLVAVRKGAALVAEKVGELDVLINNAGIFAEERVLNDAGVEATFAVNHLGPFLLTQLLLPQLRGGDAGSQSGQVRAPGRVINVASVAHTRGRIHFDDLSLSRGYTGYAAYAQSKLANVMHALALADREPPEALCAYSLHPGVIGTKLLRQGFGPVQGASVVHGARTSVMLATAVSAGRSGSYVSESITTPPAKAAQDREQRDRLWALSERLTAP
jgi:NAD(P)-dependent dehydrogenase (short-subunit alcohol dehydrogenase family)